MAGGCQSAGMHGVPWLRRGAKPVLSLVLVTLLAVAGYVAWVGVRRGQPVTLPAPSGQYPVGRVNFDWTDHSRLDPLASRAGVPRELSVWMWYPAQRGVGGERAPYAPGVWGQLHVQGPPGFLEGSFGTVRNQALGGVPVARGRFPIVVLEPGMGLSAPQYTVLAEDLASHGYLVAGVTPTYSANLTVLHAEAVHSTVAGNPPDLGGHTGPAAAVADRLVDVWSEDARFVASTVAELDRNGPFAGRLEQDSVAYVGHSFGGATALQACHTDPHCAGAVDLDGTQFGSVVQAGLHAPLLIVGAENSCVTGTCRARSAEDRADRDTAQSLLSASTGPTWCYSVDGAQHLNFTDDAALFLAPPLRNLFALGSIDGDRGLAIQDAYVIAFLDQSLNDRPQPLLSSESARCPDVRALRKQHPAAAPGA